MSGLSSGEREYALLVAQLRALGDDIDAARATAERTAHPRGTRVMLHLHAEPAAEPPSGEAVRLTDGAQIVIRPVCPDDRDELQVAFAHLGALSRFRRFGARSSISPLASCPSCATWTTTPTRG